MTTNTQLLETASDAKQPKPFKLVASAEQMQPKTAQSPLLAAQLTKAYSRWHEVMKELHNLAHYNVSQFPEDRSARYFLAEVLQASGQADLALDEYQQLREDAPPSELRRIEQAIGQCLADQDYFPAAYSERLSTGEYAAGHNAETWRSYAKRDIQRGREIVRLLRQQMPLAGKRVLDVGCGYGGMMISLAEQGANVVGVEIDPDRAQMGELRLRELGIPAELYESDICEPGMAEKLGTFDVITCQDVIEHVMDPMLMIQKVCSMLRPGGVMFLQMPNKWGAQQLMADHHYSLTGITSLSRNQAIEYWQHSTGQAAADYGVGYPRSERYYMTAFARCGLALKHTQYYGSLDQLGWFARDISALCSRLGSEIAPGLRPELEQRIRRRIMKALDLFAHASQVITQWKGDPAQQSEACDYVVRRLGLPLWRFIGVKAIG